MGELFSLVYDREAPYPRIVADTGKLESPLIKPSTPFHVEGGDSALLTCCLKPENLERIDWPRPDVLVKRCRLCSHRHFKALSEEGRYVTR